LRVLSYGQKRIAVFAVVGAVCFGVQLALLTLMMHLGAYRPVANAVAFAISAQLNFLLSSRVTWRDRPVAGRRGTGARWLAYNGTALVSLGCNTAIFTFSYRSIGTTPAAALGVLTGTCVVYLTCNLLVFRGTRAAPAPAAPESTSPGGAAQPATVRAPAAHANQITLAAEADQAALQ
jgi:putative flippase GtrA